MKVNCWVKLWFWSIIWLFSRGGAWIFKGGAKISEEVQKQSPQNPAMLFAQHMPVRSHWVALTAMQVSVVPINFVHTDKLHILMFCITGQWNKYKPNCKYLCMDTRLSSTSKTGRKWWTTKVSRIFIHLICYLRDELRLIYTCNIDRV
jgi:hypothetical protein